MHYACAWVANAVNTRSVIKCGETLLYVNAYFIYRADIIIITSMWRQRGGTQTHDLEKTEVLSLTGSLLDRNAN